MAPVWEGAGRVLLWVVGAPVCGGGPRVFTDTSGGKVMEETELCRRPGRFQVISEQDKKLGAPFNTSLPEMGTSLLTCAKLLDSHICSGAWPSVLGLCESSCSPHRVSLCCQAPGCSTVAQSWLTATSTSRVQAILLAQPPEHKCNGVILAYCKLARYKQFSCFGLPISQSAEITGMSHHARPQGHFVRHKVELVLISIMSCPCVSMVMAMEDSMVQVVVQVQPRPPQEVFKEQIQDLLEPKGPLAICEDLDKGVVVQGLIFH
ncbi:Kinesin-like protein KIF18B [Plecturocebus cupreus]